MNADERIEKLLNRFGQTISDLPKPTTELYAYESSTRLKASCTARNWENGKHVYSTYYDYICHLTDVIDRMETALETATNTMSCLYCKNKYRSLDCYCRDESHVADWQLSGMYLSEFKEFMEEQANDKS